MMKILKTDIMAAFSVCYDKETKSKPSNIPKSQAKALVELRKDNNIIGKQSNKQLVQDSLCWQMYGAPEGHCQIPTARKEPP